MNPTFKKWLEGDVDLISQIPDASEKHNLPRGKLRDIIKKNRKKIADTPQAKRVAMAEQKMFRIGYQFAAVLCCLSLILVFLYMTANISRFGEENPRTSQISERYITQGLEETGAVNIVAGMILDYRAFDTLGESHVLFTALICVMILLQLDPKNMRPGHGDYNEILNEQYFETDKDPIMRRVGLILGPCILLLAAYILVGGHLGPGGGFSGGAVLGTGMVILASSIGDRTIDRVLSLKRFRLLTFFALCFYSFAKGYVFFTGANGFENHIPKGTPGEILSAGLILPLDIAVGIVVGCTMYGFYSLFRRGRIGGNADD